MTTSLAQGSSQCEPVHEGLLACPRTHVAVAEYLRKLPFRGLLLDVGAGHGSLAQEMSDSGYSVIAADCGLPPAEKLSVRWTVNDLREGLPFGSGRFELVTCIEVIEHVEDQFALVRELARVLKPGGRVIISTPNVLNLASRLRYLLTGTFALFERPVNEEIVNPAEDHIHPVSYYGLRYMISRAGLSIERVLTDRIRRSALWLAWLYPAIRLATHLVLAKESDLKQRHRNMDVGGHVCSAALLFGRTQIVVGRKS